MRRRSEFLTLAKRGKKVSPCRWLTINFLKSDHEQLRCGWTIPRQVGGAVIRNRIKRWGREVIKDLDRKGHLINLDINVFVRPVDAKFYRELKGEEFRRELYRGFEILRSRL